MNARSTFTFLQITLAVFLAAYAASATAQQGDILILDGKRYFIQTNPLRPYLQEHPDAVPKSSIISTSCWRGYVATWEVKDSELHLRDVTVLRPGKDKSQPEDMSVMFTMFGGQSSVRASWYTGNVIIPDGKVTRYVHMGYASTFERYIVLTVEQGRVTSQQKFGRDAFEVFRKAQFEAFKKTDTYRKAYEELANDKDGSAMKPEQIEEFIFAFYSEQYLATVYKQATKES